MQRRYVTVDVFTDRAFGGNPLAVVLDAGGLTTAQMQAIASEFNYAETTFVLPPRDAINDAQVRIFTVNTEMPFAGHPNVGIAFVLANQAAKLPARFRFEEGAGLVAVEILQEAGRGGRRRTHRTPAARQTVAVWRRASGIHRSLSPARNQNRPASALIVSVGMPFLVAEVTSRDALRRARPDAAAFARMFPCEGSDASISIPVMFRTAEKPCDLQARMFFPGSSGLIEDPATGSATVAAAALLAILSKQRDGELKLRVGQGVDMGRPSLLLTRVRKAKAP